MQKIKRRIAGMTAVLMCVMNILQPVTLYASAEELPPETVTETETVELPETSTVMETEPESQIETEAVTETAAEMLSEMESSSTEAETETGSETEETEPEPVKYTVSGIYHGLGKVMFKDNMGNIYEISGSDRETTFELDEGTELTIQAAPEEGYEIASVEIIDDIGYTWKNDDRESLNAAASYEKNFSVSSNTKISVQFKGLPEETETEALEDGVTESDTATEAETIERTETTIEVETETDIKQDTKVETEPDKETDASQDGILSAEEKTEAEKLTKEMKAAIAMNDSAMTLSLGEVGQSWAMFEVFVDRILVPEFGPNPVTHYSHVLQTGADHSGYTHTAYCIQYGVSIPAGSHATESLLPQPQQDYMGYALAYGWKQNGTAYDESQYESSTARTEYAVTQAIVWACSQGKFGTDAGEAAIQQILQNTYEPGYAQAYYQQLKAAILNAETIPSFSGSDRGNAPTIQLSWNSGNNRYETTVTDANGVLDRYNYSYGGIQFEKNGNSLTIWTHNLYTDGVIVEAVYTNIGGTGSVITWDGENGTQDLATYAEMSNNVYSYVRIVTEGMGAIELIKNSANPGITSGNSCYSLAGAVYGVYDVSGNEVGRITTDVNGWGQLTNIVAGSYSLKEITAPKGFYVDTSAYNVTVTPGQTATAKVQDIPKSDPVVILLGKIDRETNANKPSGSNLLEGALFEVKFYNVQMDTDPFVSGYIPERKWILRTDSRGLCRLSEEYKVSGSELYYAGSLPTLPAGTVTIQEIQAPKGYLINNEVFVRKIVPGNSENVSTYNYPTIPETPQKIQIELEKVDSETKDGIAQGAGTLDKAEYEVRDAENNVVDTLVTDKVGHAVSKELPLGVYTVKESKASAGYLVDSKTYTVDASDPDDTTSRVIKYKVTSGEDIIRGDVEIVKFYENIDEDNDTLQGIEGVEFTFTSKTTGKVVKTIVTDKVGFATTASPDQPRGSLVFDTYIVTETKYPAGVKPIEPFEVTISEEGVTLKGIYKEDKLIVSPVAVVKKDKTTGNIIPVANTEFRLLDENKKPVTMTTHYPETIVYETFKTNEKGQFTFPEKLKYGTYYLEEVQAPKSYLKGELLQFKVTDGATWEKPLVIEYYDEPVMGKIRIEKADAETGDMLSGAEFDLIAAEDIITPDGTVRLQKGDVADHVTTKKGIAESKELYLGSYEIVETKQPQGYILSHQKYPVTIAYKDQVTPVVVQPVNVTNPPAKVRIKKVDSESGKALPGVEFKIWNKAMDTDDVDPGITADMLYKTDENGLIEIGYLSPGTYCVQETKSLYGYAPDDTVHEFTVSEDGRIDGKEICEITITNTPIEIGTKATDKVDGDQIITNMEKETIVDTVSYSGLIPGKEYTVNGVLMVKSTGKPLMDDGKEVTAELTFIPELSEGEVELIFTFNAKALVGEKIVAFESVLFEGEEIAAHADIEDEDQTVEVVPIEIRTQAKDKVDNDQTISAIPEMTIIDTVEYSRLHVGWTYTVKGILMDKSTGEPLLVDGKEVTGEAKFVPEAEQGTVDVEFTFDASDFANQELVVFEELYFEDELIAEHKDIDDKGQTVEVVPVEIRTMAKNKADGSKEIIAKGEITIVDMVSYTNLIPGREYTVSGILMDKSTQKPFLVGGKEITTEAIFVPEAEEGTVAVEFTFDAAGLGDMDLVVFEKLFNINGKEIAAHEDIEDVGQTVHLKKAIVPDTPKTGDGGYPYIPIVLCMISACAMCFLRQRNKKKE